MAKGTIKYNRILLLIIILVSFFLRIWKIDKVPVSMFSDELDVGYQAYSIIKTGRDYSGNLWPLSFQSYADYRTPVYIYTSVPFVAIFGITPLGVRLPAVIFGVLGVWMMYLLTNQLINKSYWGLSVKFGILPALLLAISPWHIQYSRAAFEATQLLFFYLLGIYLFLVSLSKPKYFLLSALSLGMTAWVYSTAKLFTPALVVFIYIVWFKDIIRIPKRQIMKGVIAFLVLGLPLLYTTFFGGSAKRFNYISVFTDPTAESESSYARLYDASVRQKMGGGTISKITSRVFHNKFTFWGSKIVNNYYQTFSAEFLFISGDPNLRHSINGMGQLYKIELLTLIAGIILFIYSGVNKKIKLLIAFWIVFGAIPSSITRDGGNHATRLILILPPMLFLISYGILETYNRLSKHRGKLFLIAYCLSLIASFYSYQHLYWVHNPWYSERSWHAGYKEVVAEVKEKENEYHKIIISNTNDDPRIFFAAYFSYPPDKWQKGPENDYLPGFGTLSHYGKYYFGQVDGKIGLTGLSGFLQDGDLYVASQSEIVSNLLMQPGNIPAGLKLVKIVQYPSGEPAFYAFTKSGRI